MDTIKTSSSNDKQSNELKIFKKISVESGNKLPATNGLQADKTKTPSKQETILRDLLHDDTHVSNSRIEYDDSDIELHLQSMRSCFRWLAINGSWRVSSKIEYAQVRCCIIRQAICADRAQLQSLDKHIQRLWSRAIQH